MNIATEKITGGLYLLPALAVLPLWYILLFVGDVSDPDYGEMLHSWFVEAPNRHFFWYHAALPVICGALAVTYFAAVMSNTTGARIAFLFGVVLALSAWAFSSTEIAIFVSIPLFHACKTAWPSILLRKV